MNTKQNNKGFSLVELIVVIAIMGILAVTLAPRLAQYADRAREASDTDTMNTIMSAAKLANVEFPLANSTTDLILAGDTAGASIYVIDGANDKKWNLDDAYTYATNADFLEAFTDILGDITWKSADAGDATTMTLETTATGELVLEVDWDGAGTDFTAITITE